METKLEVNIDKENTSLSKEEQERINREFIEKIKSINIDPKCLPTRSRLEYGEG